MDKIPMTANDILSMSDKVSFQNVADQSVLMINDSGEVLTCNETMTAFLNELDGSLSIKDIAHRLHSRFDAELETMISDLLSAIEELGKRGVLERT